MGSPRKAGNTNLLMEKMMAKAIENGHETEMVILNKKNIGFCEACDVCHKTGNGCFKKDDMPELGKKMKEANVWIIGTPVYWWGPTAQMKTFTDRWYGLPRETFQNKKAILVVPMEDTDERTASHVIGMYRDSFDYLGIEVIDVVVAGGVLEAGAVSFEPEMIQKAENAILKI